MALIIPKCNAEPETLDLTLQVYYNAKDWVSNADLIDRLSKKLFEAGIETEQKEPQSYTKKTQVLSYYGLIEWEDPSNTQSRRRISENGIKFYELRQAKDQKGVQTLLVDILESNTFGRNVLGCDSDSDLEAPNIFIKSTLLLGNLTNKEFAYILGRLELDKWDFADTLFDVLIKRKKGIPVIPNDISAKWADPKPIIALADWGLFDTQKDGNTKLYFLNGNLINNLGDKLAALRIKNTEIYNPIYSQGVIKDDKLSLSSNSYAHYLKALRTKPFLLLAGISGTGKSRIVREFAFKSCPAYLQDEDHTTPGNYCMIEVKPNWHDSSEVLGYYSNISKQYHFTKFVRFLVKAMMYPEIPFFICLDEMNLAPVEQYFAEFLSILETRKKCKDNIETGTFIDAKYFKNYGLAGCKNNGEVYMKLWETTTEGIEDDAKNSTSLVDKGLTLPDNVFIIGTVNMDDTTHQFSRKVIDRAMTIEMNGGNLEEMFGHSADLDYSDNPNPLSDFQPKYITADEVLNAYSDVADKIMADLPAKLEEINKCLEGTPFQVSYRVLNELCVYLGVLLNDGLAYEEAVAAAVDQITLMKILPRIEGDQDLLGIGEDSKLAQLMKKFDAETASYKKLKEMNDRLEGGFTRFWP